MLTLGFVNFQVISDVVVNEKVPRLFFAGYIGDIQSLQVRYASLYKVPNKKGKGKVWGGFVSRFWNLKQNLRFQNNL